MKKVKNTPKIVRKNLKKRFIKKSQLLVKYSIFFIPKKDKTLYLYINYQKLNNINIKN